MKKFIRYYFGSLDRLKCDNILNKLNMSLWYGTIGIEVYYPDELTKLPILTIRKKKINIDPNKKYFLENIGWLSMSKKDLNYINYKIIETMMEEGDNYITTIKNQILNKYGLVEEEFVFLIKNCK